MHRPFYSRAIQPWVHYVPVQPDLSDLLAAVEWLQAERDLVGSGGIWWDLVGSGGSQLGSSWDLVGSSWDLVGV